MSDRIEPISPAYRGAMIASTPSVVWWGRLQVTGLELLPVDGPLLLVGDHDSYWDTVATGIAAMPRRQVRALAKSSMWKNRLLGAVLTGMGQIPIQRGSGDSGALDRAIEELRKGACIGIYPEGTRSLGRALRARSGVGYLGAPGLLSPVSWCSRSSAPTRHRWRGSLGRGPCNPRDFVQRRANE